jgi:hypothetical protein
MFSQIFKNSVGEIQENALIINNTTILADDLKELDYFEIRNIKKLLYLNILIALFLVLAIIFHWIVALFASFIILIYSKYFQFTDYFIIIGIKNKKEVIIEKISRSKKEEIIYFIQKLRDALKS